MIKNSQKEICIISPWVGKYSEETLSFLKSAAQRGVQIKIIYGYTDNISDERERNSEQWIERYKHELGKMLTLKRGNTHVKLSICDETTYLSGSYNLLSSANGYIQKASDEYMLYEENRQEAKKLRQEFFGDM